MLKTWNNEGNEIDKNWINVSLVLWLRRNKIFDYNSLLCDKDYVLWISYNYEHELELTW